MIKIIALFCLTLFLVGCDLPAPQPTPPPKFHNGQAVVVRGLNIKGVVHFHWDETVQIYYVDNNGQIQSQYLKESELGSAELEVK